MSEILLLINIDDDKKLDIEDIEQSLTNDFENIGEVKKIDRDKLKKFFNQFESLLEVHEDFINKVNDIDRARDYFSEPITPDKWDNLDRYYIKPFDDAMDSAAKSFDEFMEE